MYGMYVCMYGMVSMHKGITEGFKTNPIHMYGMYVCMYVWYGMYA